MGLFGKKNMPSRGLLRLDDKFTSIANNSSLSEAEKQSRYRDLLPRVEGYPPENDADKGLKVKLANVIRGRI